jgi:hypothetical protein
MGMGGAATIVGIRALKAHHLHAESVALQNTIEAFALPIKVGDRKKYLFGKLPIADVFITWAQMSDTINAAKENEHNTWRVKFQVWSGTIGIVILIALVLMWRRKY